MAYASAHHSHHDGLLSSLAKGVTEFVSAWFSATPLHIVYQAVSSATYAPTARTSTLDLPTLMRE
ncbi:hypothetical protein FHW79_002371 [Azospirillum sp. OGB3]|uniref:hypothetical protein n=1 Tax=Azospirillum sp. OGB3 TaxID=2587012 RepID=UPI0016059005|nr:hypothetical protein [Azospirillum sp. OGB3]MBB3264753.1 hypothetical protein [Azospirillum sp. OGB3]